MGKRMQLTAFIIFATVISLMMVTVNSSQVHIVSWNLPTTPNFYEDWAKQRNFSVGDKMVFNYLPGLSNLVHVPKSDFDRCTIRNVIHTYFQGHDTILLDRPGDYYFFNSVGKHCELGQKLHVLVQ